MSKIIEKLNIWTVLSDSSEKCEVLRVFLNVLSKTL